MLTKTENNLCLLLLHLESDTGGEVDLSLSYFHCSIATVIFVLLMTGMSKEMLMLLTLHLITHKPFITVTACT